MGTITNTKYIDLNCDVGEGIGNEAQLLPLISSCNIACGGHAGDEMTMREVIKLASQNNVKVGAHPSYPDKVNFGRISLDLPVDILFKSIQEQIKKLEEILNNGQMNLNHIKAHGALYNDLAKNKDLAIRFLNAVQQYKDKVFLYVPYGSEIAEEAIHRGFHIKYEAFADRNYNKDLSLVPRTHKHALIEEPEKVLEHLILMVEQQKVQTLNGEVSTIFADTFCVHGDTPNALQILMYLSKYLPNHQINIAK